MPKHEGEERASVRVVLPTMVAPGSAAAESPQATALELPAATDTDHAWARRHGAGNFEGLRIPFFAKVRFLPSPTSADIESRWHPPAVDGVFLGYKLNPGADWSLKEFYVAHL